MSGPEQPLDDASQSEQSDTAMVEAGEQMLLYDLSNSKAWLQFDGAVDLAERT